MPEAALPTQQDLNVPTQLRIVLGKLSRRLRLIDADTSGGMTPTKVSTLLAVDRNGATRLSELAEHEGLGPSVLSRLVGDFVDAGIFKRSYDDDDRRAAWVKVTAAGHKLAEGLRRDRTEAVEYAMHQLSPTEQRRIVQALPALEALAEELKEARRS